MRSAGYNGIYQEVFKVGAPLNSTGSGFRHSCAFPGDEQQFLSQETGKVVAPLNVIDPDLVHGSVFHGDGQLLLAAGRLGRLAQLQFRPVPETFPGIGKTAAEFCAFNTIDELVCFIPGCDSEDSHEFFNRDHVRVFRFVLLLVGRFIGQFRRLCGVQGHIDPVLLFGRFNGQRHVLRGYITLTYGSIMVNTR